METMTIYNYIVLGFLLLLCIGVLIAAKVSKSYPDPVRDCELYKDKGCSHVDEYLCDYPDCDMLTEHLNEIKKLKTK